MSESEHCTRCGKAITDRTPSEGTTTRIRTTRTVTTWRFSFSRLHWVSDPHRDVRAFHTDLNLCDQCAGDVFLFAARRPAAS